MENKRKKQRAGSYLKTALPSRPAVFFMFLRFVTKGTVANQLPARQQNVAFITFGRYSKIFSGFGAGYPHMILTLHKMPVSPFQGGFRYLYPSFYTLHPAHDLFMDT